MNPEEMSAIIVVETLPDLIVTHPQTQFNTHLRVRGTLFTSVHYNRYLQTCFETKTRPEKIKIKFNTLRETEDATTAEQLARLNESHHRS